MRVRQIAISAVLIVLVCTPGFILAQGGGSPTHWQLHPKPERSSTMQMQGMMQQMGGMIEHMAARIQAGPLTPEQGKQMSELMVHIADMTNHLAWMISGGPAGAGGAMTGPDMPQQMATMMERMTEMHKRMMSLIAVPASAPQKDKK